MKNRKYNYSVIALVTALVLILSTNCTRDFDELELAGYPTTAEVFIDGFSAGLKYAAFGGSKVTAFDVDEDVKYEGTASMRFEVPDFGDPEGGYAGGVYYTTIGRDLSEYTALTFWAKASKSATLDLVGFGNDLGESKYLVSLNNAKLSTFWKKYIIPIPDPSLLTQEKGMFYYSEGPEDGLGYTFWIDEVKFEKLGTIAHKQPMILDGNDKTESTVNGISIPIDGLSVSFNMPNGIDQTIGAAPAYFTFSSSDNGVATVDESGLVTVISAGTAVITANEGGVDALGSLTVESAGDFVHAPTPTADPGDVISIFSNAYTNVPVDFYNGYWQPFQTTLSADFTVNDDDVLYYTNFNFVGIQFSSPAIDATNMTHLHMDVWIPNAVDPADRLQITVKDMGPDGTLDDGNDPSITYVLPAPMASQSWISVDIDLSGLPSKSKLAQLVLENLGTGLTGFYLDNVYLYNDGGGTVTEPTVAAPTPPARDAADVISIYGDAYTNLDGTDYPDWGQATVVSDVLIEGNNTLKFAGLNFQGIQLANAQDVSGMEFLHLDFWTANSSSLNVFLISPGPTETAYALTVPTTGWSSIDIPISSFSGVDLTDVIQMKFDGNGDIFLDNIYFFKTGGTVSGPAVAAPTPPARDAADVVSIYSDAYTGTIAFDNFDAGWCGGAAVTGVTIQGDNALKKNAGIDCHGIDFSNDRQDLSEFTHIHFDFYTDDADLVGDVFNVKLVDFAGGGGEASNLQININTGTTPGIVANTWVSVDVDITALGGVVAGDLTRSDIAQIGITTANLTNVWYDNIYLYKDGGSTGGGPTTAAPTPPTRDAADVVSVYSDAYTGTIAYDNFDAGWCGGAAVTGVTIEGNNTLKKNTGVDCHGIDFSNDRQDLTAFTHIHFDFYTDDADLVGDVFNVKLVDFAGGAGEVSALEVNINTGTTPGIVANTWVSVDVDITSLGGVVAGSLTRSDIAQIGITTANLTNVWYDNIYFYKDGGGTATEPGASAPTPTQDPGDVYSFFSDAYTNILPSTFSEVWGDGTVSDFQIGADNIKKYTDLNFQAIGLSETVDLAAYTHIHIDVWTPIANKFGIKLQDFGADDNDEFPNVDDSEFELESSTEQVAQTWVGHDFAIADFTGLTGTANLGQIQVLLGSIAGGTQGTAFIDNIYLYNDGGSTGGGPTTAAPTPPTRAAADVVSIYSDAYTNITVDNFDAGWCGGAAVTGVTIEGNNTLKKNAGIDCHGINFASNRQDLTEFTHIHFDFYTDDADLVGDVFNVKLVDWAGGAGEASALEININTGTSPGIVANAWVSVDIDITALGGVVAGNLTRSDIAEIGITTANLTNVWYDNIYLYK